MADLMRPEIEGISQLREVGSGGYSTVYVGMDEAFDRPVAVKVLHRLDDVGRRRFDRERATMGRMEGHRNVITPYRSGFLPDGSAYLVMEYATNGSLQDQIDRRNRFDWIQAAKHLGPVAEALAVAHSHGILHRDVKPANILFNDTWVPKLTDFGISSLRDATATDLLSFTLTHAPPETFASGVDRRDERSDLYSLASTMYAAVSGRAPFDPATVGDSVPAYMNRIMTYPVPSLGSGDAIDRFLAAAMAKDPANRPPSAAVFLQALSTTVPPGTMAGVGLSSGQPPAGNGVAPTHRPTVSVGPPTPPVATGPAPRPSAGGNRWLVGALLGGVAVLVILAGAILTQQLFNDDDPTGGNEGSGQTEERAGPDSAAGGPSAEAETGIDANTETEADTTPDPAADQALAERVVIQTGDLSDVWSSQDSSPQIANYEAIPACGVTLPSVRGEGETASAGGERTYSSGNTAFSATVTFYETEQLASERGPLLTVDLDHQECIRTLLENSVRADLPTATGFVVESQGLPAADYGQRSEATQYVISFDLGPLGRRTLFTDEYSIQIGRAVLVIVWSGDIEFDVRQVEIVQLVASRFEREMATVGE